jgi:hypothetical protein
LKGSPKSRAQIESVSVIATHGALHGRLGFQRGAVDDHRLASQELLVHGDFEHKLKDFVEHLLGQPIARVRQSGMVGG